MSLLSLLGISTAYASSAASAHPEGSLVSMLPMLVIFVGVFYFLLVRPQQKRAKEHKALMSNLSVGDEVVTTGGIVGRLVKLRDNFIVLGVAEGMEMTLQKGAIASVLPKGTIESVK